MVAKEEKCAEELRKKQSAAQRTRFQDPVEREKNKKASRIYWANFDFVTNFWSHVDKSAGPSACWPWLGYTHRVGYGRVGWKRRVWGAHQVAWQISFGPIPKGLCVLHKCNNKLCVNPAHLKLGTHKDNMADALKARVGIGDCKARRGATNGESKLTENQIIEIRTEFRQGRTQAAIARSFKVRPQTVHGIVKGKSWVHVK